MTKKTWHINTMEYYLAIQKNGIMPFSATQINIESLLSEMSERERKIPYITHIWNLIYDTNSHTYVRKTDSEI